MSVYNHPSKAGWQMIKISHGRNGKAEYIPFPGNRDEALIYEQELRGITDLSDPDFADHLPSFRLWYRNQVSSSTFDDCERAYKHLIEYFGSRKIRHITPLLIEAYKTERLQQPYTRGKSSKLPGKRTITRELAYLARYLGWLRTEKGLTTIQPKGFRNKETRAAPPAVLTISEISALLQQLTGTVKAIVMLMAFNGLRRSEAFNLRPADVDLKAGHIRVWGKGGKWRLSPLASPELRTIITVRIKESGEWLLPNPATQKPFTDIRKPLDRARRAAGIDKRIYPHLLRHSFASALVGHGVNLRIVQELLGHASLEIVQTYTHLQTDTIHRGAAVIAQAIATVANPPRRTRRQSRR